MNRKIKLLISGILLSLFLTGCSNTDKLNTYYDGMQKFTSNVQIITEELDMIDVTRDSAAGQISTQLDKLLEQFRIMSELEVPKNFAACEDMGDDAYNYMFEAVNLYKQWLADPDNCEDDVIDMAQENYVRAMQRVNYISIVLQGGMPEGEGISTFEEDATDFAPVIDDSSADESNEEEYEEEYEEESSEDEFSYPEE